MTVNTGGAAAVYDKQSEESHHQSDAGRTDRLYYQLRLFASYRTFVTVCNYHYHVPRNRTDH